MPCSDELLGLDDVKASDLVEVCARAEGLVAASLNDDAPDGKVALRALDRLADEREHLGVERVELLRSGELDREHTALARDLDYGTHTTSPAASASIAPSSRPISANISRPCSPRSGAGILAPRSSGSDARRQGAPTPRKTPATGCS